MYPSDSNPGYGVFVKNICLGLENNGVHTEYMAVISGREQGSVAKLLVYLKFYWRILTIYFKRYDCLYVHYPSYSAPILNFLQSIKRKPMVVNYHGEDLLYPRYTFIHRYLGRQSEKLGKKADFIVVPSDYFKGIVMEKKIADNDKIVVSPSGGIDGSIFQFKGPKEEREYLHLGFVGRLQRTKGTIEFVEACKKLSQHLNIKVTIIGYGELNNKIDEIAKEDKVFTFIKGISQEELPNYYNDFDLFFFPSKRKTESLGLVGIEAMACGTPVLGSDIGGITSYLRHGKNGYLLRLDHLVDDMVKYTIEYSRLNDYEKERMAKSAIETSERFEREDVCERLSKEFKKRIK